MAENKSITITLKNETGSGNGADLDTTAATSTEQTTSKGDKNSMAKAAFANMAMSAANTVVNELIAWGDYGIDRYLNLHDDYIGQRNLNVAQHYIGGAVRGATTIASFAMTGAAAGPWGALAGAVIGTVVAAAQNIRSNLMGEDQQNIALKQMELQLSFTRNRAGWSTHAASIGEDL